jgi:hypothetical protein
MSGKIIFRTPAAMLALLGAVAQSPSVAQTQRAAPKKPLVAIRTDALHTDPRLIFNTTISGQAVTPSTISFTATDPDLGSFSGSSPATVSWNTSGNIISNTWTLSVAASVANFTSCATVPATAIKVTCGSVSGGTGGTCAAAFQLSTTSRQIASGSESILNGSYSVNITFALADSWRYVAEQSPPCTLGLSYTINAP